MAKESVKLDDRFCFSIKEMASLTGLSEVHIYGLIKDGKINAFKVGRRTLIDKKEYDRWVKESVIS